jgi:hypothetical protein
MISLVAVSQDPDAGTASRAAPRGCRFRILWPGKPTAELLGLLLKETGVARGRSYTLSSSRCLSGARRGLLGLPADPPGDRRRDVVIQRHGPIPCAFQKDEVRAACILAIPCRRRAWRKRGPLPARDSGDGRHPAPAARRRLCRSLPNCRELPGGTEHWRAKKCRQNPLSRLPV